MLTGRLVALPDGRYYALPALCFTVALIVIGASLGAMPHSHHVRSSSRKLFPPSDSSY